MLTFRSLVPSRTVKRETRQGPFERSRREASPEPLGDELLDLYAAIAIAVPLALILKDLWT